MAEPFFAIESVEVFIELCSKILPGESLIFFIGPKLGELVTVFEKVYDEKDKKHYRRITEIATQKILAFAIFLTQEICPEIEDPSSHPQFTIVSVKKLEGEEPIWEVKVARRSRNVDTATPQPVSQLDKLTSWLVGRR